MHYACHGGVSRCIVNKYSVQRLSKKNDKGNEEESPKGAPQKNASTRSGVRKAHRSGSEASDRWWGKSVDR